LDLQHISIHGHDIGFRTAGSGPVVVLIHGLASSSETWGRVMPALAERTTVVAPDLIGHGGSAKALGDYSLGALANGVRDLLNALGHERATLVGHSLGGGVAMQFAFQFPDRCERMVLVDSGGLGREVALYLRALSFPGLEYLLPPVFAPRVRAVGVSLFGLFRRVGLRPSATMEEGLRVYEALGDGATRQAFFHTLRAAIDLAGQRPSALDRLYLMAAVPTLLIWGERDSIIPLRHGEAAHQALPGSILEVFEGIGHQPQQEAPERFVRVIVDFIGSVPPADVSRGLQAEPVGGPHSPP
jgi:pimeloyl-ACP methyl ester carboxylesterase